MKVNADMLRGRNTDSGFIRSFDHTAVGADIRNAGVGIFGHYIGRCEKRTAVETGVADRHGKSEQSAFGARNFPSLENDLFDRSGLHDARCDRMAQGSIPTLLHLPRPAIFFQTEGHLVDLTRSA